MWKMLVKRETDKHTCVLWNITSVYRKVDIWGIEQYEVSFIIWMCGGLLLDVPRSRLANIFRGPRDTRPNPRNYSFVAKNQKRVAEVWIDEYKQFIYDRLPDAAKTYSSDITKQIEIRKHLKCKSFKWFMEEISPDFVNAYPPIQPPGYALGVIQSIAFPQYCVDTMNNELDGRIGLFSCDKNVTHPQAKQFRSLSHFRDIRKHCDDVCLDVPDSHAYASIWMCSCHKMGGNQFWSYNVVHQLVVQGFLRYICMEAFVEDGKVAVHINPCDKLNPRMRWKFGWVNETAINEFWKDVKV